MHKKSVPFTPLLELDLMIHPFVFIGCSCPMNRRRLPFKLIQATLTYFTFHFSPSMIIPPFSLSTIIRKAKSHSFSALFPPSSPALPSFHHFPTLLLHSSSFHHQTNWKKGYHHFPRRPSPVRHTAGVDQTSLRINMILPCN